MNREIRDSVEQTDDITELKAAVNLLETRNEELSRTLQSELMEAGEFGKAQLALEDIGWKPLQGFTDGSNSFTLEGLHRSSELCRAVATINPLVRRGLKVRTGYIWGSGVSVVPKEFSGNRGRPRTVNTTPTLPEGLEDVLTGTLAQMEIESSVATDGNLDFLVSKSEKTVQRIPFEEITDGVSEKGNREKLLYVRRTWNDWGVEDENVSQTSRPFSRVDAAQFGRTWMSISDQRGASDLRLRSVWYPTPAALRGRASRRPTSIRGEPIDFSHVLVHMSFNRLTGDRWGVPDVLPAIWWTKAYKEYLENCATLSKAYARFAWKVTNDKSKGVRRTAATLAQAPRTDPSTGQPLSVGASAVLGAGQDISPVGGSGHVNFDAGRPLIAMVAAALDVPLYDLTADSSYGNRSTAESQGTSSKLVMRARQRIMDSVYKTVFELLGLKVRLRWPEISDEPIHRKLQAIDMAVRLGLVSAREARTMLLDAWGDKWTDFPAEPPKAEDLPLVLSSMYSSAPEDTSDEGEGGGTPEVARGSRGGVPGPLRAGNRPGGRPPRQPEPLSAGDHELRDEG